MTPCAECEERLLDYETLSAADRVALDAHVSGCAGCRDFRSALARADAALEKALGPISVSPRMKRAVLEQVHPSPLPEVLDGIGWLGVAGIVAAVSYTLAGPVAATFIAGAGLVGAALWNSLGSFRALKS